MNMVRTNFGFNNSCSFPSASFPKYSSYFQTTSALKRLSAIFRDDGIFGFHIVCSLRLLPARISYNSKGIFICKEQSGKGGKSRKKKGRKKGKRKRKRNEKRGKAKQERRKEQEKEGQKERKEKGKEKRKKRESKAGKAERAGKRRTERKERERERETKKRGRAKWERGKEREKEEKEAQRAKWKKAVSSPQPCPRRRVFPLQKSRNPRFRL